MAEQIQEEAVEYLNPNNVQEKVAEAIKYLRNVPDDGFKMNIKNDNPKDFEDSTEIAALGWRLGSMEINATFENKPRLKFYLTCKALDDTYQTQAELEGMGMKFDEVTKEWREELTQDLKDGFNNFMELPTEERIGRLEMVSNLTAKWFEYIDLINIEKTQKNSEVVMGESYLTLKEIEDVGETLLKESKTGALFGTKREVQLWGTIGNRYKRLSERRGNNLLPQEISNQFEAMVAPKVFELSMHRIEGYTKETKTEEMKKDIQQLAGAISLMPDAAPQTVWMPVRDMLETQLGGGKIWRLPVEQKYEVTKPLLDLIEKNREMLEENNIISGGANNFVRGLDRDLWEYCHKIGEDLLK